MTTGGAVASAGLVIPVYLSTIGANGRITDRSFEAAQIHLDDMAMCGYTKPITARVIKDGVAYRSCPPAARARAPTASPAPT